MLRAEPMKAKTTMLRAKPLFGQAVIS